MRYFLDTEFWERPGTIELISIGIVSDDGREFYAENARFDWDACDDAWLHENVRPHMRGGAAVFYPGEIKRALLGFASPADKPEFWAYYADYDWVVFCWLFGRMIDLPDGYPMYCRDLKQWADQLGGVRLPEQTSTEHDALADARWNRDVYDYLRTEEKNV